MGERVRVWVIVLGYAACACGSALPRNEVRAGAQNEPAGMVASPSAPRREVVRIASDEAPLSPGSDAVDPAPRVLIHDHGSGRAAAPAAAASVAAPLPSTSASAAVPLPSTSEPARPSPGAVSNAAQVVGSMRSDFRACYQATLAIDPNVTGTARVTIRVRADGSVSEAATDPTALPQSLLDCILLRARAAKFDAPEGGSAVIAVPVTFVRQQNERAQP